MNDMTSNDDGGSNLKECRFAKFLIYKLDIFENKCSLESIVLQKYFLWLSYLILAKNSAF